MAPLGGRAASIERLLPWLERARQFSGWDLSALGIRELDPAPPWDYAALVTEAAAGAESALDMGTGGGERLAPMRPALPRRLVATEEWHVNAPIARDRLAPLGVAVVRAASRHLPFAAGSFDLVINRHEELAPRDVDRVLRAGGMLVTQQVGPDDLEERRRYLPRLTDWRGELDGYVAAFTARGYDLEVRQHRRRIAFPSLGAFTCFTAITPWDLPDFDLERDIDALLALEEECGTEEGIVLTEHRVLLVARKPR